MKQDTNKEEVRNIVNEPGIVYENQSADLLKTALNRTHFERFLFATRLYKIQQTLNKAVVTHKADTINKQTS